MARAAKRQRPTPFGVPEHAAALAHDVFNGFCVSALNILNALNWRHDAAAWSEVRLTDGPDRWSERWTGEYHDLFVAATFMYMVSDMAFLLMLPQCVKMPGPILVHHLFAILAMAVPWWHGNTHGYTLGVFMLADINTMLLVLRKLLLRGKDALLPRMALGVVSAGFYLSWVALRLVAFPVWLFTISGSEWIAAWQRTGAPVNLFIVMPLANMFAVYLNFQWTWDLVGGVLRRQAPSRVSLRSSHNLAELAVPLKGRRASTGLP